MTPDKHPTRLNHQPCIFQADKSCDTVATLVTKTVERIHAQHSPEDRLGSREAPYERDSVEGPLGTETPESREPFFLRTELVALSALVDEAGPKVNKTHLYEEMLEHATPSEAAVCLYLSALLSLA